MSRSWGYKGRDSAIRGHVQSSWLFPSLVCSPHPLPFSQQWQSGAITLLCGSSDSCRKFTWKKKKESLLEKPWSTATTWPTDRNNYQIFLHSFQWNDKYTIYEALSHSILWICLLPPLNLGRAFYLKFFLLFFSFSKEWSDSFFLYFQSFLAEKIGNERITFCPSKFCLASAYKLNLSSKKYPNSSLAARRSNFNWGQKNPPSWALYKGTSYINGCCF